MRYAYVRGGQIVAISDARLRRRVEAHVKTEIDEETKEVSETVVPTVPWLIFDDEIKTDLDGDLDYVDGKIIQKQEDITSE